MMHHLRPNVSLISGIKGRPMTEPSGRAEARMPLLAPVGWPKSVVVSLVHIIVSTRWILTFFPSRQQLRRVDNLRIEPGSHLDTDDTGEKQQVHASQMRLLPPWDGVIHGHPVDDIVGLGAAADHLDGMW